MGKAHRPNSKGQSIVNNKKNQVRSKSPQPPLKTEKKIKNKNPLFN